MKKVYFRILAICLSLFLSFSILYKDYIQAEALEWVGVAVGYDTAFKFLLGLLGVTVGVGVAEEVDWGTLRENAIQVQLDQGNSQAEVSAWWSNVIHGSLDTASDCWSSFKEFVSDLTTVSSGFPIGFISGSNIKNSSPKTLNYTNANFLSREFNSVILVLDYNSTVRYFACGNNCLFSLQNSNNYLRFISTPDSGFQFAYFSSNPNQLSSSSNGNISTNIIGSSELSAIYIFGDVSVDSSFSSVCIPWPYGESINDNDFQALYPNIGDIALNPENADTLGVDVIPLPWENIGVSEDAIQDIIDDAIERVIDGTMSLENYWEYVQNITNTYAYSIENNYLLPNENGEDKKADDKVKENTENGAFVLYGLEKVFPFCIPFDIYAFITLLKADPVAPVIEYPIYNPVTQENEIITIDFSEWESVVVIFRYIFDFLLIIGLLLLARPLVGAGGDS